MKNRKKKQGKKKPISEINTRTVLVDMCPGFLYYVELKMLCLQVKVCKFTGISAVKLLMRVVVNEED